MNKRLILKIIGLIMVIEAALLLLPMIIGLVYNESDWIIFLYTALMTGVVGTLLMVFMRPKKTGLFVSDGFIITAAAWIVLAGIGAIPFCLGGVFPSYLDSLFETVSGFTTTGISVLPDIEALSRCMLFWRGFTNWIGGMGVLVFMIALAPVAGGASIHLYRAEAPGPVNEKMTAKISTAAKYLYFIYIGISVIQIIALRISGLSFFYSAIVTFGTVATGGYTFLNTSLATLTVAQQIIVEIFMVIAGMNFVLFFMILTGKIKKVLKNTELWVYLIILAVTAAMVAYNAYTHNVFGSLGETVHHSIFGTISVMTSTGFASTDMNIFPWFSKGILLLVMFIGGCSGSTAGGIKVTRVVVMIKAVRNYLKELAHPRSVSEVKVNGRKVNDNMIHSTVVYFCLLMVLTIGSMIIVSQDPIMDFYSTFASVATAINNNGIEFKTAGLGGFATFQWYSKIIFIFDMLIGRLEIFPILILLSSLTAPIRQIGRKIRIKKSL